MAYSRAKSWNLRGSSRYGRKKRGGVRRRSYGKKRAYRKKTSKRRSLTDRMSHKKRDIMCSAAAPGVNPSPGTSPVANQPLIIGTSTNNTAAAGVHMTAFCPSYRTLVPSNYSYTSARTATRTFVKGIGETYHIVPSDQSSWEWRRIVVSLKGNFALPVSTTQAIGAQFSTGNTQRYYKDITGDTTGIYQALWDNIQDYVFRGVKVTDWLDQMTAPLDNLRVDIRSDTRRTISSANDAPRPRTYKTYVPINKSVVYADEENGTTISPTSFSVDSKSGIGDIYILDLFTCRAPISTVSTQLQVSSTQTYYWHEK